MNSKHTPGPWTSEPYSTGGQFVRTSTGTVVAGCKNTANARLIAAAPELAESLQTLVRRIERDNLHTMMGIQLADARAALAKAGL